MKHTTVRDVMTEEVEVAAPTDLVIDVVDRMVDNEIRPMPVTHSDGVVIGLVSARDALTRCLGPTARHELDQAEHAPDGLVKLSSSGGRVRSISRRRTQRPGGR